MSFTPARLARLTDGIIGTTGLACLATVSFTGAVFSTIILTGLVTPVAGTTPTPGTAIVAGTPITVTGIAAMTTRIIGTIVSETRYVTSAAVASMRRRDIVVSGCALEQAQPGSCCVSISLLEPVYRVGEAPKGTPPA